MNDCPEQQINHEMEDESDETNGNTVIKLEQNVNSNNYNTIQQTEINNNYTDEELEEEIMNSVTICTASNNSNDNNNCEIYDNGKYNCYHCNKNLESMGLFEKHNR
eukprot:459218_1